MTRVTLRGAGFTLLEVMVSLAILAISLAAVFSTEAGAIRMAARARKMGNATLLARCKMGEVEEQIAKKGLPAVFDQGTDKCCTGGEIDGFTCDWLVDLIQLPDTMFAEPKDGKTAKGTNGSSSGATTGGALPGSTAGLPPLAATPGPGGMTGAGSPLGNAQPGILSDPSKMLSGSADMGGMASMAMTFIYPILKPSFEGQIRRATINVHWREGSAQHSFSVTQYLVGETAVLPGQQDAIDGVGANGQPVAPGTQAGGAATAPGASPLGGILGGGNQPGASPFGLGG